MYYQVSADTPLQQGEIIDGCPILSWSFIDDQWIATESLERVIVITQACDIANEKTTRLQVALVHSASKLVSNGILKAKAITDQVRRHRVYGWYFLPDGDNFPESIVDLRDLHTIPKNLLLELASRDNRIIAISSPYREHLAQHFAVTYSRIGLPEPYETKS